MPSPNRLRAWALATALLVPAPAPALACPNCKEALADQPADAARLADGFSWSILVMLGVPFSLLSVGGLAVRRAVKLGILPEM
ncbi:hypothetical protein [Paludisphaera mucosa]|uniref:Uncharacterized protein n=1 Tax=Paludisphaera mucosa TaxID=3030827 RepID=A0ABT6FGC2_9BACT|nr:hypothetical protein [Paludisphaera mucosa]MDG3006609.1 hypothetical protein [Paludisphaera mucosa]